MEAVIPATSTTVLVPAKEVTVLLLVTADLGPQCFEKHEAHSGGLINGQIPISHLSGYRIAMLMFTKWDFVPFAISST